MFKQLSLNRLSTNGPLCDDVVSIIKSFAFYDIQTANIKKLKKEIVHRFLYAQVSRFRPNGHYTDNNGFVQDSDNCEHWSTCLSVVPTYDNNFTIIYEKSFQACNCSICGEYFSQYLLFPVPQKITCRHAEELHDYDENYYSD
jgi:hypothetical protein